MDFIDKVVLITGGAGGIGSVLCKRFSERGACVVCADIDELKLQKISDEASANNLNIVCKKIDLGDASETECFMKELLEKYGESFSVIINNVASGGFGDFLNSRTEDFDKAINVGLRSAYITSREFAKYRKKNDIKSFGRIINISSTRHIMSEPNGEINACVKGGLYSLTHATAQGLNGLNITVNSISPGRIVTDNSAFANKESQNKGKFGTPEDVANACFFLCDEANNFINGQDFVIDGGMIKK